MRDLLVKRCLVIMHASREFFSHAVCSCCRTDTSNSYRPTVCSRFLSMRWSRVQPCCERDLDFPRHILQTRTPQHTTPTRGAMVVHDHNRQSDGVGLETTATPCRRSFSKRCCSKSGCPKSCCSKSCRGHYGGASQSPCPSRPASAWQPALPVEACHHGLTKQGIITRNWTLTRETDV